MSNFVHPSITYDVAVLHGRDMIVDAERRRQTRRRPHRLAGWTAGRRGDATATRPKEA